MNKYLKISWSIVLISFVVGYASATPCPVTISSDSSTAINDVGAANCVITINTGVVLATLLSGAVAVNSSGTGLSVTNNGTIRTTTGNAVNSSGTGASVSNNGTISTTSGAGVFTSGAGASVTNSGTITTTGIGHALNLNGSGSAFTNSGTITTTSTGYGVYANGFGSITNTGVINASGGRGIETRGSLTTINNSGTISSTGYHAIYNYTGTLTNLINTGTVSSSAANYHGLKLGGSSSVTIANFTNAGAMTGGVSGYGVYANPSAQTGTIINFNNSQGGNSASPATTALTYYGKLPTYYNIIVKSPAQYGQIAFSTPSSTTTFGIYSGGVTNVAASTLTAGTYSSVLTGITSSHLSGSTSGTYGSYSWSLNNSSGLIWDLIVTCISTCSSTGTSSGSGGSGGSSSSSSSSSSTNTTPVTSNITAGSSISLNEVGVTANPVLDGGTIVLAKGQRSGQTLTVQSAGGTIVAPSAGAAQLYGALSGSGRLTFNGTGTTVLSGVNTFTGGTVVESGTLSLLGGTLGSGEVYVASGAQLVGTGSIAGPVTVAGLFKPGNSPGYIVANANITMTSGAIYQQDIAGTTQSSASSPVGATGYYSYLNITGGQFIINTGATLTPALSNLFNELESGYGSTPYTPLLGDRFRILTAEGGISGKFSTVTQPAELAPGTQFLPFYNMDGTNSLDLAVIPKSYATTIAITSGNKNAQSVGAALDRMVLANQAGVLTVAQDQLLYAGSTQTASSLYSYAQSLAGEVYAAAVSVIAQTTQRVQQAVLTRLGDTMGIGLPNAMTSPAGNTALMATSNTVLSGGVSSSAVSSNPGINHEAEYKSLTSGNVWGDLVYQKGNRSSDSNSGGWNSNLYQLVFGSDFYVGNGTRLGGGIALSSTTLNPTYGSGTIQQGSVFAYGKMPVEAYEIDVMASFGLSSSDLSRGDITSLSNGFRNKTISGNDTMVSLGLSRPLDMDNFRITPYARVTWQMVTQSAVDEGSAASALSVNSYTGNGVRGVMGIAAGSKANDPMTEKYTYRAYVGVGVDSSGLLTPTLNASLAGMGTNITTPNAGTTFVQAGLYGTAKVSDNAYAFAGLSGEARSGQTLGAVNVGMRIQF